MSEAITTVANELRGMRIGYVPNRTDLSAPGDRRRFCYYAAHRGLSFELAEPSQQYDIVVISEAGDVSVWKKYPRTKGRLIFDLIDSYLAIPATDFKSALRGVAKFAFRQSRFLELNYRKAIQQMCERSDAVVCTTEEQQGQILGYCPNVHVILDFQSQDVRAVKRHHGRGPVLNLVWEGLPYTLVAFRSIAPVLRELRDKQPLDLHLITDLRYGAYLGGVWRRSTTDLLATIGLDAHLYEWNALSLSAIATACDLALIPLQANDPFMAGKPENKLLLLWRMGLPVLTTRTPAYERAMARAGLDMTCVTPDDWRLRIVEYGNDATRRAAAAAAGLRAVTEHYNEDVMLRQWDRVFESVLA